MLTPIGEVPRILDLAEFFGWGVDYLSYSYLGVLFGTPFKFKVVWEPIIKMIHERLVGWNLSFFQVGVDFIT